MIGGGPPPFSPSSLAGLSFSSMRDATTYACRPCVTSSAIRAHARFSHAGFSVTKIVLVLIG